jgi:hypothetical protein
MLARPGPVGLAWEECWMVHDWLPAHGAIMVPAGRPRRLDWDSQHAADPLTHTDQPKVSNTPLWLASRTSTRLGRGERLCHMPSTRDSSVLRVWVDVFAKID